MRKVDTGVFGEDMSVGREVCSHDRTDTLQRRFCPSASLRRDREWLGRKMLPSSGHETLDQLNPIR